MGYMGFGMQKWIYSRNPKKVLFDRKGIPSFNPLQSYSRTFSIKPNIPVNKTFMGILSFVIGIILLFIGTFSFVSFNHYSKAHTQEMNDLEACENKKAFRFLMASGKERLKMNQIHGAYSEFKLAYKIYPNSKELHDYLAETLLVLCEKDQKYCSDLNVFLQEGL